MGFKGNTVKFYSRSQSFFELSNFFPSAFYLEGKWWRTVEHYFQAKKVLDEREQEVIRNAYTPAIAKKMGLKVKLRSDWEQVKEDVMYSALKAKFTQNASLNMLLLSTGDCELREDSPSDNYWGGRAGAKNRLGELLVRLREELNKD